MIQQVLRYGGHLTVMAEVALVIFVGVFLAMILRLAMSSKEDLDRQAALPLESDQHS